MRPPRTYTALEAFGRQRLSRHFQMRNFVYSEISNHFAIPNIPVDPDLAIAAGRKLAEKILEPLVETFGPIDIRSGYRSPTLNDFGANHVRPQKCAQNEKNYGYHIWDMRDDKGRMGACVTVAIPWFAAQYNQGRDWIHLAWWLRDHLEFQEVYFFPKDAAFNISWRENPQYRVLSYITPKGHLHANPEDRADCYADFPEFRGIKYPSIPSEWPQ